MYWAAALLYVAGSRFLVRYLFFYGANRRATKRVAIYGAGEAGAKLSSVLLGGPDFEPVAFIDDKRALQGNQINGIKVLGPQALPRADARSTTSSASCSRCRRPRSRRRREILNSLEPLGIHVQSAARSLRHHLGQRAHR